MRLRTLSMILTRLTGFKGKIIWDKSKLDGQPRRCLDISLAQKEFGFKAKAGFTVGLKATIDYYNSITK